MTILKPVYPSAQDMAQELAKLRAENEALRAKAAARSPNPSLKITDKGGISVYGLGRFPTTLYAGQWQKLGKIMPELLAFIEANKDSLSWKE